MTGDLVVCSLEPWDEVWRRNQYLIAGLLRRDPGLRVLFVEPPADPLNAFRRRERPSPGLGLRAHRDWEGRLSLLQPTKWFPRVVGPFADSLLVRAVRRAARACGMVDPLLWVNDPALAPLVPATGWSSIYDITDDWLAAVRPGRELARLRRNEDLVMRRCGAVVVCSPGLVATKGRIRDVDLVPNAVDVARYRAPHSRPGDLPAGGVALYVGTLHEDRLDVDLCIRLGESLVRAGATAVFVGPDALGAENSRRLRAAPGVEVLGARPSESIPGYLQHADVLVVPHLVDDFTDSLDPIKLYEYRVVGRPIVATAVAGFRQLQGSAGVTVVGADEFPGAAVRLLGTPGSALDCDIPDWSDRVESMVAILERVRTVKRDY